MATNKYLTNIKPKLGLITQWARRDYEEQYMYKTLKVSKSSWCKYKKDYPELTEALSIGKDHINALVENQVVNNSLGFTYTEQVVTSKKEVLYENGKRVKETVEPVIKDLLKFKPSDPNSAKYFLNNRDPENWKDKQDINLGNADDKPLNLNLSNISTEELRRLLDNEDKE